MTLNMNCFAEQISKKKKTCKRSQSRQDGTLLGAAVQRCGLLLDRFSTHHAALTLMLVPAAFLVSFLFALLSAPAKGRCHVQTSEMLRAS